MGWRAVALGLAGTLVCGGTAYALISSSFAASAFGPKGHENIPARTITDDVTGSQWLAPAMQFMQVDEATAERLVGANVQHVGKTVSSHGYTLTVEDMVTDDQGLGIATFTLAAPGGQLKDAYEAGYAEMVFETADGLRDVGVRGNTSDFGTGHYDFRSIVDREASTETEIHGVLYFGPFSTQAADDLVFYLVGDDAADAESSSRATQWEADTEAVAPGQAVASRAFADASGHTAHISPLGIVVDGPFAEGDRSNPWVANRIALEFAEGSEYLVKDDATMNCYVSWYSNATASGELDNAGLSTIFNRLVDPAQVATVEATGPNGTTLTFTPQA